MIRNLKALGLMAVAALAMSAMFASAAQAQGIGVITAGKTSPVTHTPSILHGEQLKTHEGQPVTNLFETENSSVECDIATFNGNIANGTATTVTITPHYTDCRAEGLPATVTMNKCDYLFRQPTSVAGNHSEWTGKVDLICPVGSVVEVHVYLGGTVTAHNTPICTITVKPVTNLAHVIYRNKTNGPNGKDDITVDVKVTGGIPYEEHGAFCPDGNTVTKTNGKYTSKVTLTAKDSNDNPHDLWITTGP